MKTISPLSIFVGIMALLLVAPASQALALEIEFTEDGTMQFYEDAVLGENTGRNVQPGNSAGKNSRMIRQVFPAEQKQLRIQNIADHSTTSIEVKNNATSSQEFDAERLHVRIPASVKPVEKEVRRDGPNFRVDQQPSVREFNEDSTAPNRQRELTEDQQQRIERIRQERQERINEQIEIIRSGEEGEQKQLELRSRNVRAHLKQGSEFVLDPETNSVTVTTPSGITHELNHLPDQAVERMIAAGVISADAEPPQFEIDVNEEGEVNYTAVVQREKRLLGLFRRRTPTEVMLNDSTGEIEAQEIESDQLIDRILDNLSF